MSFVFTYMYNKSGLPRCAVDHLPKQVLCNICMRHLFNNCASFVQYLSTSVNSFVVFVEHFQGGATRICVFLCISEFAPAPRCVFEVLPMMASRQGCLLGLLAGRWKTLFSELCNICAILQKYLSDNVLKIFVI